MLDTQEAVGHWKAHGLNLEPVLYMPDLPEGAARRNTTTQDHGIDRALDNTLIQLAEGALQDGRPVRLELPVRNVNRTVGTMLGYEVTKRWGAEGLPDNTIDISFRGSAGQSFGAFLPRGSPCGCPVTPTTTWARACPAAGSSVAPDPRGQLRRRRADHRGQRHRLRRHRGRDLPARRRGRAVLRPELGRGRGR